MDYKRVLGIFLTLLGVAGLSTSGVHESFPAQYESMGLSVSSGAYWTLFILWIICILAGAILVIWDAYWHFKK